ncbi:cytosolic phospholipase A2 isoform X2 [Penaeus vannamei]|uniref:cytosolic phospholipase A2 isoform X2 n=1 Tax=Penaeus vannamei TaxID=6689 RepID=UPI000F675901|nr:cytosolic phospholipase A2-like isoform X2 [Penaeus vannamei]
MVLSERPKKDGLTDIMTSERKPKLSLLMRPPDRRRSTSCMWDSQFDPFQVFEVEHESCLDFEITIKRGESITKGSALKDLMDTPDPYVILKIPGCSNSSKRTSHVDNCTNPLWNETFHFYLDPGKEHILKVLLMDANYTVDETLGEDTFCVNELTNDITVEHTFIFPGGSKVHTELKLQKNKTPDLRFSLALCQAEKTFLRSRRRKVLEGMQRILGAKAPSTEKQVPILGILGSGGGFRAMMCMSGAVKALQETGILDCATYIAGLSGSSWYISTLYAHDKFPNVTHDQIQKELRASVTSDWKWKLLNSASYVTSMIAKYKRGQPVSFTDFFGHLLGDVLLKGAKHKKLTDTQKILVQGIVPMPLYTCLHAKRNVSCRSFSEWVEFSPYEIGIAKYGTFMKSEDFGNKFIVGKKIKHFEELPLHFLQGVWGSAFTILIKRLVMEGGKKDIVQIMRDAQKENDLHDKIDDLHSSGDDSETEDEEDIEGHDDKEIDDEEEISMMKLSLADQPASEDDASASAAGKSGDAEATEERRRVSVASMEAKPQPEQKTFKKGLNKIAKSMDSLLGTSSSNKAQSTEEEASESRDILPKAFSFDTTKRKVSRDNHRKFSTESDPGVRTEFQAQGGSRLVRQGAIKTARLNKAKKVDDKEEANPGQKVWAERRKTLRKTRVEKKAGLWEGLKQNIMLGTNILNSRAGRAGEVLNPFRGLSLRHSFPISPFATDGMEEEEDQVDSDNFGAGCRYEPLDNKAKKLFIVDSGLAFNSPYPLLLRPQRAVDIYLSFDFSQRPEDKSQPFKELLLAERWAIQNKVPFPPIEKQVAQYENEEVRECYVFKHPMDHFCPVILHFPLVNNNFRKFKAPGVPRETEEEKEFADFPIFDDPNNSFSSMNFVYELEQFDRLTKLIEFNTLFSIDIIKKELEEITERKKSCLTSKTLSLSDVVKTVKRVSSFQNKNRGRELKLTVSPQNEDLLKKYANVNSLTEADSSDEEEYTDALQEL